MTLKCCTYLLRMGRKVNYYIEVRDQMCILIYFIYLDLVSMETSLQPLTASLFFQVPSSAHEILYIKEEEYL